jgi:hypothetical protein
LNQYSSEGSFRDVPQEKKWGGGGALSKNQDCMIFFWKPASQMDPTEKMTNVNVFSADLCT